MQVSRLRILSCFTTERAVQVSRSARTLRELRLHQIRPRKEEGDEKVFEIHYEDELQRLVRTGARTLELLPTSLLESFDEHVSQEGS